MSNSAISSSDPQALDKLKSKLEALVNMQTRMKTVNAYYRKHGTCKGCKGLDDARAADMDKAVENGHSWEKQPYAPYMLTNNNANIQRIKKRIAELETKEELGYTGWQFGGGEAVVNTELDRLQLFFEGKPDENIRKQLKSNGFKWAPSQGAWQRQLNDNAIYSAGYIDAIKPLSGKSVREIQPKASSKPDKGER